MKERMTLAARAELANPIRRRYQSVTNKQKGQVLDEFIAAPAITRNSRFGC